MFRLRFFPAVTVLAAMAAVSISCGAQAAEDSADRTPANAKVVPARPLRVPFSLDLWNAEAVRSIQLRSPAEMTEQDRLLEADAESSIAERAGFADLAFNEGKWSYQQLVCPALPNHLFLRFTRNNGVGDASLFSASIPRNGEGHVRIIPIQRRGYSLFSPAPINALTIAAFNHIRSEDKDDRTPGWLGTGLCYAALAGANPMAAQQDATKDDEKFPAASSPLLEILQSGGAVIQFTDISAMPRPMEWRLIFNPRGRLLKAEHARAWLVSERAIPLRDPALKARPIPAS